MGGTVILTSAVTVMLSSEYCAVNLAILPAYVGPFAGTYITIGTCANNGPSVISLLFFNPDRFAAGDASVTDALSFAHIFLSHARLVCSELCGSRNGKGKTYGC